MNRGLTRLGFTALALVVGQAYVAAQDATTGAVFGTVKNAQGQSLAGARVILDGGRGQMEHASDSSGSFRITGLIPGKYTITVSADGYERMLKQTLNVGVNQRTPVNVVLTKAAAAIVEVVAVSQIDAQSVTTGTQFSAETFNALPLGRSFTSIASMAPGVVGGGIDAANPSIGGGSGLENQYVIDGANTTNPGYGSSGSYSSTYGSLGSGINTDFIQEVQVKSFGLEAEYGQTTGGIVNAITRSGSNNLEGSAFLYMDIDSLQARNKVPNLIGVDQPIFDGSSRTELGFTVSGPIIKDKLFYFIGYNPIQESTKRTAPAGYTLAGKQYDQKKVSNAYYAKFQFQLNTSHLFEFSAFGDPGERKNGPQAAGDFRGTEAKFSTLKYGTNTYTLKWTGTFFDSLLVEGRASQVSNTFERQVSPAGLTQWAVTDTETGNNIATSSVGLYEKELKGKNSQYEFKMSKSFGDFDFKVGILKEAVTFDSTNQRSGPLGFSDPHVAGTVFTTGLSIQKRYQVVAPTGVYATDRAAAVPFYRIVRGLTSPPTRNTKTDYLAYFVQGGYKLGNVSIKAGLRWEEQKLIGTDISYTFKAADNMSPRLGITWDIEGNSKSKAYAFFGRYFEKVPLDIAVRALSTEKGVNRSDFTTLGAGFNSLSGAILNGTNVNDIDMNYEGPDDPTEYLTPTTTHFRTTGSNPTEILKGTKSMYQDEIVLGYDTETSFGMTFSNRLIFRKLGRILEDLSLDGDSYFIGNPGENENEIRKLTGYTGAATFPKPERNYWALEIEARKSTTKWQAFMNFRISKVEGNYEGLYRGDNGQDDPNISSLYDLPVEALADSTRGLTGREQYLIGALPSDRTIVANVGFNYVFDMGLNLGFLGRLSTGTPITSYLAHPVYENAGEVPVYGRGTEGRTPTIYTMDMSASYVMGVGGKRKLTFRADVFNMFNTQRVLTYDTNVDVGINSTNANYMRANGYDAARSVRMGVKFSF